MDILMLNFNVELIDLVKGNCKKINDDNSIFSLLSNSLIPIVLFPRLEITGIIPIDLNMPYKI
jgi:hypothetical protein